MAQCSILYVTAASDGTQVLALRALGFRVDQGQDLPPTEALSGYHAVIVRAGNIAELTGEPPPEV